MSKTAFAIWLVISLVWIGACVAYALSNWPHMPLDISHGDAATIEAFNQAVTIYLVKIAAIALVPSALIYMLMRMLKS